MKSLRLAFKRGSRNETDETVGAAEASPSASASSVAFRDSPVKRLLDTYTKQSLFSDEETSPRSAMRAGSAPGTPNHSACIDAKVEGPSAHHGAINADEDDENGVIRVMLVSSPRWSPTRRTVPAFTITNNLASAPSTTPTNLAPRKPGMAIQEYIKDIGSAQRSPAVSQSGSPTASAGARSRVLRPESQGIYSTIANAAVGSPHSDGSSSGSGSSSSNSSGEEESNPGRQQSSSASRSMGNGSSIKGSSRQPSRQPSRPNSRTHSRQLSAVGLPPRGRSDPNLRSSVAAGGASSNTGLGPSGLAAAGGPSSNTGLIPSGSTMVGGASFNTGPSSSTMVRNASSDAGLGPGGSTMAGGASSNTGFVSSGSAAAGGASFNTGLGPSTSGAGTSGHAPRPPIGKGLVGAVRSPVTAATTTTTTTTSAASVKGPRAAAAAAAHSFRTQSRMHSRSPSIGATSNTSTNPSAIGGGNGGNCEGITSGRHSRHTSNGSVGYLPPTRSGRHSRHTSSGSVGYLAPTKSSTMRSRRASCDRLEYNDGGSYSGADGPCGDNSSGDWSEDFGTLDGGMAKAEGAQEERMAAVALASSTPAPEELVQALMLALPQTEWDDDQPGNMRPAMEPLAPHSSVPPALRDELISDSDSNSPACLGVNSLWRDSPAQSPLSREVSYCTAELSSEGTFSSRSVTPRGVRHAWLGSGSCGSLSALPYVGKGGGAGLRETAPQMPVAITAVAGLDATAAAAAPGGLIHASLPLQGGGSSCSDWQCKLEGPEDWEQGAAAGGNDGVRTYLLRSLSTESGSVRTTMPASRRRRELVSQEWDDFDPPLPLQPPAIAVALTTTAMPPAAAADRSAADGGAGTGLVEQSHHSSASLAALLVPGDCRDHLSAADTPVAYEFDMMRKVEAKV